MCKVKVGKKEKNTLYLNKEIFFLKTLKNNVFKVEFVYRGLSTENWKSWLKYHILLIQLIQHLVKDVLLLNKTPLRIELYRIPKNLI